MSATHGAGDAKKLVKEWDRTGTAHLFYRTMHFPFGMTDPVALRHLELHEFAELEAGYERRLQLLDRHLEPLLDLDVPIIITGDHGEDFYEPELMHMHHHNHSDEVLRVPFFGRGFEYAGTTPIINKHALRILRNEPFEISDTIRIWSEGPFDGEWKYIVIDEKGKTIITSNGMRHEAEDDRVYTNCSDHSKLNARLKALGYL